MIFSSGTEGTITGWAKQNRSAPQQVENRTHAVSCQSSQQWLGDDLLTVFACLSAGQLLLLLLRTGSHFFFLASGRRYQHWKSLKGAWIALVKTYCGKLGLVCISHKVCLLTKHTKTCHIMAIGSLCFSPVSWLDTCSPYGGGRGW